MNDVVDEILCECICWWIITWTFTLMNYDMKCIGWSGMMIIWRCNKNGEYLWDYNVDVVIVVDVVKSLMLHVVVD